MRRRTILIVIVPLVLVGVLLVNATARDREVLQSGALKTSEIYTETFEQAGTYDYFCEFHPNMEGTVVVQ